MEDIFEKVGSDYTLSQIIEQKIEDAIRQKKFLPGQKLPSENELSSMFGVSRTALREALRMVSARGLIQIRKGSGIFVNDFSSVHASKPLSLYLELNFDKDYILHIIEVRQMVEPGLASLAAQNRTERDLQDLDRNLVDLEMCDPKDAMREAGLDLDFHTIIARASANPIIPVMLNPVFSLMPKIKSLVISHVEDAKSSAVEYHRKIVDQIRVQDAEGAFDAMTEHLKIAKEHNIKMIEEIDKAQAISS